jgi:putative ABC transport system permease protein
MFAFVKVAEGTATDQARTEVEQVLEDYPNVQLRDQSEFKAEQSKAIDQVLGFVLVLLLLSVVIAVFGIVNTLSLSIYERIRELGLLRAVGMSRRQVRRMVRSEAVIVAILGAVLGMVIGLFFGWALQRALVELGVDRLRVPLGQLLIYLVVAALCGVVAAVWPARRAARLDVLQAIAYE